MKKYLFSTAILLSILSSASYAQSWSLTGNSGTNPSTHFVGTKDNQSLVFRTNNGERMRISSSGRVGIGLYNPSQRLDVNGNINILKGYGLYMENHRVLFVDSAKFNTFVGNGTGTKNTVGTGNTATGYYALNSNITGISNAAYGYASLQYNIDGSYNTATGPYALSLNTSGYSNTANGGYALYINSKGYSNTATGYEALYNNTEGSSNTAVGSVALAYNTVGYGNTAVGSAALYQANASENTAVGYNALANTPSGNCNVAVGNYALTFNNSAWNNTAVGYYAGATFLHGWNNTFIGSYADATAGGIYNSVALGNYAKVTASNQVRLGNASTTSIGGFANWSNISDGRVKKNLKEDVPGLAFINRLKPVTYNLDLDAADRITGRASVNGKDPRTTDSLRKGKLMANQPSQMEIAARKAKEQVIYSGFVAQDVEKAAKALNYNFSGVDAAKNDNDLYGLRYSEFVVPLVKAVQELSKENNELRSRIEKLESLMSTQQSTTIHQLAGASGQTAKITSNTSTLEQNMPNPFNRTTTINYTLPQQFSTAKIIITDNTGKAMKEVKVTGSGKNSLTVDASTLSSGTYHYSLIVDGKLIATKQMMLTK
jgi:hypothetical protein